MGIFCDGIKIANSIKDLQNSKNRISSIHLNELINYNKVQISDYLIYELK